MTIKPESIDRPIIVIGAGRSGTSMIRETLAKHCDVACFEFEMNYLWRYGNAKLSHDLLTPEEHLTDDIVQHIQAAFLEERNKQGRLRVLDKTVANVMRPRYVQAIFPDARFLHVIRDGRAVTASAMKQWSAPQSTSYYASKVRTIPFKSLPIVAYRFISNMLESKLYGHDYRQSWGPRWPGIDEAVKELPLAQVCARQWKESVNATMSQKDQLVSGSYMEVRYEELVQNPQHYFTQIRKFFELSEDKSYQSWLESRIDANRQDKWRHDLSESDMKLVDQEIGPLLKDLNYI